MVTGGHRSQMASNKPLFLCACVYICVGWGKCFILLSEYMVFPIQAISLLDLISVQLFLLGLYAPPPLNSGLHFQFVVKTIFLTHCDCIQFSINLNNN